MYGIPEQQGLGRKVQFFRMDPPSGICLGSNSQPFIRRKVVLGRAETLARQPRQISACRDNWVLGIRSYLGYLRYRFLRARSLLSER